MTRGSIVTTALITNPLPAATAPYNHGGLSLTPGTRLGAYEMAAQIGVGGMGQVYRANGLEKSRGITALVMELVEGPTLADRIAPRAIPIDTALPIARQIGDMLEAAHRRLTDGRARRDS